MSAIKNRLAKLEQQLTKPEFIVVDARKFGNDTDAAIAAWSLEHGRQPLESETVIVFVSE